MQAIFDIYNWDVQSFEKIDQGLINSTFIVNTKQGQEFILQSINHQIFKKPEAIDHNIKMIGTYLNAYSPEFLFTHLVPNFNGATLSFFEGKYYRAFVKLNGKSYNVLSHSNQAKEAASAFGAFTSKLADIAINDIQITLPDFHNLSLRYQQFETSLEKGDQQRLENSKEAILFLKNQAHLVETYEQFIRSEEAIKRVTHHDTKISNVLFDQQDKALCVIDLDTVMPGYFISDVGDMCRTYLPNVSEEEVNIDLIKIDKGRWTAIKEGYLENMGDILTSFEMDHFEFAGQFMIYMQALRFLTDHLNKDVYYGAKYNGQNYVRAINQIALLEAYNKMIY
jgi:Ser/Thr protein kinase RdoA (MazF antagonist)